MITFGLFDQPYLARVSGFPWDPFTAYTDGVNLDGLNKGRNWKTAYVFRGSGLIHWDPYSDYTDGDNLHALNGGQLFPGAYVAKEYQPIIANDSFGDYTDGAALDGLNEASVDGINRDTAWSGAYDTKDYQAVEAYDSIEDYTDGVNLNSLDDDNPGGAEVATDWDGAYVVSTPSSIPTVVYTSDTETTLSNSSLSASLDCGSTWDKIIIVAIVSLTNGSTIPSAYKLSVGFKNSSGYYIGCGFYNASTSSALVAAAGSNYAYYALSPALLHQKTTFGTPTTYGSITGAGNMVADAANGSRRFLGLQIEKSGTNYLFTSLLQKSVGNTSTDVNSTTLDKITIYRHFNIDTLLPTYHQLSSTFTSAQSNYVTDWDSVYIYFNKTEANLTVYNVRAWKVK